MTGSAHERYRRQLTLLADDTELLPSMSEFCPPRAQASRWRRLHGRFRPDEEPYATLVFEAKGELQRLLHVDLFHGEPPETSDGESVSAHSVLGWVRLARFPADRILNTLPDFLARHEDVLVVRYRPGRRCTLRFRQNGQLWIAKLYPERFARNGRGEEIHAAGLALWLASTRGELSFAVALPYAWEPELRLVRQQHVDGDSMRAQLFGMAGEDAAHRMGEASGSLSRCSVRPTRFFDEARQLVLSQGYAEKLISIVPELAPTAKQLLDTLAHRLASGSQPCRPIHGDLAAGQWFQGRSVLCLLDFDEFAWGDPELDAAAFLHEIELEYEMQPSQRAASLCAAFLAGYRSVAGALRPELLASYLAHKRLYRALTVAHALRPDGDERADRILRIALADLIRRETSSVGPGRVAWSC